MPRTVLTIGSASISLALDGPNPVLNDFSCQVIGATLTASANVSQVPATFCAPASDVPSASSWALDLRFLQDWTDPDGLSMFLYLHDGERAVFTLTPTADAAPAATGTVTLVAGSLGGEAGTPLEASVTLPCLGKPDVTPPAVPVP